MYLAKDRRVGVAGKAIRFQRLYVQVCVREASVLQRLPEHQVKFRAKR